MRGRELSPNAADQAAQGWEIGFKEENLKTKFLKGDVVIVQSWRQLSDPKTTKKIKTQCTKRSEVREREERRNEKAVSGEFVV